MPSYKDKKNGTWFCSFYYTSWTGERNRKVKRGFKTKKESQEWEIKFLSQKKGDMNITFKSFVEIYKEDLKDRLKLNTWLMKNNVIDNKITPYFKNKKMSAIKVSDIIAWQNEMIAYRDEKGKPYSPTYLKTIHNQLRAIFNHAVRYHKLSENPARTVGNMGSEKGIEMKCWTREEYLKFSEYMMDDPVGYYYFQMLIGAVSGKVKHWP